MLKYTVTNLTGRLDRFEGRLDGDCSSCGGRGHSIVKVSHVFEDEEPPEWPGPNAQRTCVCGRPNRFNHVVHRYRPHATPRLA
jgi:hypothetical protein